MKYNLNFVYKGIIFILSLVVIYFLSRHHPKHKIISVATSRMMPINVATRGIDAYKQIGILSSVEGTGKVLPFYGRRTYNGSNRWNYFTRANDHLSLKIPVSSNGRDCDTQNGCDELYEDDVINIPEYNGNFSVKLYNNTPRYIPF
mgnify:CR=1 FL=1|tara:strand:+ start:167 stop:604 length:438 start_codon:yes stop_codon:yes gene_type:complete